MQPTRREQLVYYWVHHPAVDYALGAVVGGGVTGLAAWRGWGQLIASADAATRRALFQVVAAFSGTLLGLTLTSLSILVGLIRSPVVLLDKLLPGQRKVRATGTFISSLVGLAWVFVLCLWALINDTKEHTAGSSVVQAFILGGLALAALRTSRVVWVLWKMVRVTATAPTGHALSEDEQDDSET